MSRTMTVVLLALALLLLVASPALAHDHLFNATNAAGVTHRGFANPVAGNPSGGTALAASRPATVPGGGDPKVGVDTGTPASDLTLVSIRSGGHGTP